MPSPNSLSALFHGRPQMGGPGLLRPEPAEAAHPLGRPSAWSIIPLVQARSWEEAPMRLQALGSRQWPCWWWPRRPRRRGWRARRWSWPASRTGRRAGGSAATTRTGGNGDNVSKIASGTRRDIFDVKGAGVITHIWVTIAPPPPALSRHDVILRMYWDGETDALGRGAHRRLLRAGLGRELPLRRAAAGRGAARGARDGLLLRHAVRHRGADRDRERHRADDRRVLLLRGLHGAEDPAPRTSAASTPGTTTRSPRRRRRARTSGRCSARRGRTPPATATT